MQDKLLFSKAAALVGTEDDGGDDDYAADAQIRHDICPKLPDFEAKSFTPHKCVICDIFLAN